MEGSSIIGTDYEKRGKQQKLLNEIGGYKLAVDGIFGKKSMAALKDFQGRSGLKADGIFGPATEKRIMELLKK